MMLVSHGQIRILLNLYLHKTGQSLCEVVVNVRLEVFENKKN